MVKKARTKKTTEAVTALADVAALAAAATAGNDVNDDNDTNDANIDQSLKAEDARAADMTSVADVAHAAAQITEKELIKNIENNMVHSHSTAPEIPHIVPTIVEQEPYEHEGIPLTQKAKRTLQNKLAQKAFRLRRKLRIEHLENIESLYSASLKEIEFLKAENEQLRKQLNDIHKVSK